MYILSKHKYLTDLNANLDGQCMDAENGVVIKGINVQ